MADIAKPCNCIPYSNLNCCSSPVGISVVQPQCQSLPDGSVVNNPAYVDSIKTSFWTYKFITDCNNATRAISNFVIPICATITDDHILVSEKIDGCGSFSYVNFTLTQTDPNFGQAPVGFQFLKVETSNRYGKGVCVEYRLEIVGNYPVAIEPIQIKAANNIISFNCEGGFLVPQCNPIGTLVVSKACNINIINNQAIIEYEVRVSNTGNAVLDNVQFIDKLYIPTQLTIGSISIVPESLDINTNLPGEVVISGNLGTIEPGNTVIIRYSILIAKVSAAGVYSINNIATASSTGTQSSATSTASLNVVKLNTTKCCKISEGVASYVVSISNEPNSPDVTVNAWDSLFIPGGITVIFNDFSGCIATFDNSDQVVPTNVEVKGPAIINIKCNNLSISMNSMVSSSIIFTIVSSAVFGTILIKNTVQSVTPTNPNEQIFLGAGNFPVAANISVSLQVECDNPC